LIYHEKHLVAPEKMQRNHPFGAGFSSLRPATSLRLLCIQRNAGHKLAPEKFKVNLTDLNVMFCGPRNHESLPYTNLALEQGIRKCKPSMLALGPRLS